MDRKEAIEIPFGAFDSELKGWEYTIPEGMEAEIKDGKIIVREKDSDDERIRKQLLNWFKDCHWDSIDEDKTPLKREDIIAWFEKQGSQNLANSAKICKDEQKPSWSEEDERVLSLLLNNYKQAVEHRPSSLTHAEVLDIYNWLKSLKERYTWKPSEEQMRVLEDAKMRMSLDGYGLCPILQTLINDLKKLKG